MNIPPSPTSYNVLLIEEDRILAEALELCLEYIGIETTHVAPGELSQTPVDAQFPDVIVLDFHLTDTNRQRTLASLADLTHHWPIPVIALTTRYDYPGDDLAFISQCVMKPFGFQELSHVIGNVVRTRDVAAV